MEIKIYSQDGTLKLTASPGSGGQCVKQLQGDSELSLSFDYFSYVALDVNDYVDFCGDRYWLLEQYRPKEVSTIQWRYDVKLYGIESLIKRYLVIEHTDGDANPVFTLTAPASQHMLMIVECLNNATGTTDWHVGTVLATGNITIDYTGKYCDEGLRELAEAANTEYWFSGDNGKTLNLSRCERGETIELEYGAGLISLERDVADNAKFYTRLYPVGSSRNINPETYGHTRLQLPNNQKYVDLDIARYGVIDHYEQEAFAGIYPRYTGTVSTVRVEDRTDEDGTEFKVYFIKDASLPFNPNNFLLPNEKIRISFQTGDLQGLGETDDHYFEADYNSTTGEFEIINIWTDGEQLPRPGLEPEAGNSYIPWNISMPQTYITRAEQELAAAVNSYNQAHFVDNSVYRGTTNHVWIEADQSRNIYIGRLVKLVSSQYFPGTGYRNSRIVKITRRLDLPSQMELEISDAVSTGTLTKINDDIRGVWDFVKGLETDDNGKWLSKRHNDTAQGLIRFIRGLQVGERFVTGLLGEGGIFRKEADGTTYIEADKLYIRMKAYFDSVEIRDYKHSAGNRIQSPAGAKCCRVEWIDASGNSLRQTDENLSNTVLFRCYFRGSDGEDEVRNNFVIGDQAYCHVTTVETEDDSPQAKGLNMKHYWRLVVGRNANGTLTDDGEHWIDLSNKVSETLVIGGTSYTRSGYQSGSDVPEATDDIIQLGNINDTDRQGAIIEFVTGADAPSYQIFQGINSFNLNGKNYIGLGYSTQTGRAYLNVYGDTFIGAMPDEYGNSPTYLKYNAGTRSLEIKAKIDAQSTIDGETLAEFIAQNTWTEEQIDALITAGTEPLEDAIEEIQRQVDGSIATWFYDGVPTLNNQPASGWTTAELKNEHLGDLYYDNLTGYAYRFKYDDANRQWSWGRITDVDVTKALADSAKAQDTADHKRRIFVVQPTPPYDQGDLWVNATYPSGNTETNAAQNKYYNDVLRCNTTKASGTSFAIADWGLASKYTDDQALLDFKANQYVQQLTNGTLNQNVTNAQNAATSAQGTASSALTQAQAAEAHAAAFDAIKQALDVDNRTIIDGGLVLSTLIALRDSSGTLWSGISGAYSTSGAYGGGLAAWFGGGFVDRRNSDGTWNNVGAKVGFRFDGSGYVAGGAISWDATGLTKVTASKISALEIDLNGDEVATENWVSSNFVSITFFERLFQAYNGSTIVHPNNTSTIDNIKAMFGFWTEQYISALGQGSGGSSGVGDVTWDLLASSSDTRPIALSHLTGALSGYATQSWVNSRIAGLSTSLAGLSDVNVSGVTSGQYLKFNGQEWVPDTPSGGSGTVTAVKVGTTTYNPTSGVVSLPAYPTVPTNVSAFTNDAGYTTNIGTVTQVKVGTTAYNPSSGIVSLPAYPTTLPASDVSAWAKASTKPSYSLDEISDGSTRKLADYLPLSGGTMTGQINSVNIKPKTDNQYYIGDSSRQYFVVFTGYLNSASNKPLAIASSNGDDDIYINTSHNIGIGHKSPTAKLDISGTFSASGNSSIGGTLNVAGATKISSSSNVVTLVINTTTTAYDSVIAFSRNDTTKSWVGYSNSLGAYIQNATSPYPAICITDNGTPYYTPDNGTTKHTLIHEGNADFLPLSGGTMTGNIKCRSLIPTANNTYDLGSSSVGFRVLYTTYVNGMDNAPLDLASANGSGDIYITTSHNVGIGTKSPSYKLHVDGSLYCTKAAQFVNVRIGGSSMGGTDTDGCIELLSGTGYIDWHYNGSSSDYTTRLIERQSGVLTCYGSFVATGAVSCLSDIREKNILGQTKITVEQIANMRSIVYRWKDNGDDHDEHVGSIAQDWQKTLPQVVLTAKDEKKTLSMQYGVAALVSAITIARKVVDHERRINELEDENRKLKEQLKIA